LDSVRIIKIGRRLTNLQ